jgi:hypothetical protein
MSAKPEQPPSTNARIKALFDNRAFVLILIASSLRFMGGYSIAFWGASFFT